MTEPITHQVPESLEVKAQAAADKLIDDIAKSGDFTSCDQILRGLKPAFFKNLYSREITEEAMPIIKEYLITNGVDVAQQATLGIYNRFVGLYNKDDKYCYRESPEEALKIYREIMSTQERPFTKQHIGILEGLVSGLRKRGFPPSGHFRNLREFETYEDLQKALTGSSREAVYTSPTKDSDYISRSPGDAARRLVAGLEQTTCADMLKKLKEGEIANEEYHDWIKKYIYVFEHNPHVLSDNLEKVARQILEVKPFKGNIKGVYDRFRSSINQIVTHLGHRDGQVLGLKMTRNKDDSLGVEYIQFNDL